MVKDLHNPKMFGLYLTYNGINKRFLNRGIVS